MTETETATETETVRRQTDRQTDGQRVSQTDRQSDSETVRETETDRERVCVTAFGGCVGRRHLLQESNLARDLHCALLRFLLQQHYEEIRSHPLSVFLPLISLSVLLLLISLSVFLR